MLVMEMFYSAYGLMMSCSFTLPGMPVATPAGEELPSLEIVLREGDQLRWSGTSAPPEWRGLQGDGRELVIERGSAGDLLFSYGDLARIRLDPPMRRLECAPSGKGLDWQRVLLGKVIPAISVMLGYEALHAAAVDSPDGVVAIMAPSGSGKSTLALELVRRGWPLFADDVLTLSSDGQAVKAHPGTPHMNLPEAIDPDRLGETLGTLAGERWVGIRNIAAKTRPVRMLCLLERRADLALGINALPANPLLLAPYVLGLSSDPERLRSRFELHADLLQSATLVRLTAGLEHSPTQLTGLVEEAVMRKPELVGEAAR